jgi:hypothetical protein
MKDIIRCVKELTDQEYTYSKQTKLFKLYDKINSH